jgi:hypothetical protein
MAKFKVYDSRRILSFDPKRLGKEDLLFIVEIDGGVRFPLTLPVEGYTEAKLKEAVKARVTERGQFVGQEFEI